MLYKCECGHIFSYPKVVEESRGECFGFPAYETMYYCPKCGDDCFDEYDGPDPRTDEEKYREQEKYETEAMLDYYGGY